MASRKRLESETYEQYRKNLKIEEKYTKIHLRGTMDAESVARHRVKAEQEKQYQLRLGDRIKAARAKVIAAYKEKNEKRKLSRSRASAAR